MEGYIVIFFTLKHVAVKFSVHVCTLEPYFYVMPEHICGQAFLDFGYYDLVKPLERRRPKLSVQNDDRSIRIGF